MTESLFAQDSRFDSSKPRTFLPVLEQGKVWYYKTYYPNHPEIDLDEDFGVIVDGMVNKDGREVYVLRPTDPNNSFVSWAYEEEGAIWYYYDNEDAFIPVIDFNLNVGDLVLGFYEITGKEFVNIEGTERCVISFDNGDSRNYWCEGIGAIDDCFMSPMSKPIGEKVRMTECWIEDTCIFNQHTLDAIEDIVAVKEVAEEGMPDMPIDQHPSFDILGRRISAPAPGQLYISDGKKHIAR